MDKLNPSDAQQVSNPLRPEELAAHRTAIAGRTVALFFIAVLVSNITPWPAAIYTLLLIGLFVILGWASWLITNSAWARPWHQYAFVSADFALLAFTLLAPNPLSPVDYPPQFTLRFGGFIYFFVLLAGLAYVYQPRLVVWGGISAAIAWAVGLAWLFSLPDTVWDEGEDFSTEAILRTIAQPTYIDVGVRIQELVVFLIAAGLLALAVRRSRKIALRQARLARERENLGRYFPKQTADLLAQRADPFGTPTERRAAVLFADLVAFTSWSEKHSPGETIDLLRQVHGLLADVVFRHNGTLDKFIGDGVMATFGTPEPTGHDAFNAVAAMIDMVNSFSAWEDQRAADKPSGLKLAIGAHYGPVVIGNIGSQQRLEFAVLGDTVNVASRLEGATRLVGCQCLASRELVEAAVAEAGPDAAFLAHLTAHGDVKLRGRDGVIDVFRM